MKLKTDVSILLFALIFTFNLSYGQELTILHTNDMHSKLTGYGPESEYSPMVINNDSTQGGFARLATLFNQTREKSPNSTLIVDAGDFLMGTLFHAGEAETGFQLNLMKKMGYDYITLGNHEFEFGPVTLAKILNAAEKKGGFPQIVASNIKFSKESADDELEAFQNRKLIKDYVIFEKNGLKIGMIGLLGKDAVSVAPATKPVEFADYIKTASRLANYLKNNEKVDLVIALSHSGLYPDKEGKGYIGEDIDLAKKVSSIDIILSGHTHVKTPEYIKIGTTYIVQTGSYVRNLGKINLNFKDGKIVDFRFELIPVNDQIIGDKKIDQEIEDYTHFIEQKYLSPVNLTYKQVIGQTNFDLKIDFSKLNSSNIGPFIADASKYYIEKTGNQVDFSIVASGTIREDFEKGINGILTVPDAFRVMSLGEGYDGVPGYPLARIYITGKEVKKLMEIVVMSRPKGGDGFLYLSGIKTTINSKKGFLNKVQKVAINGNEIDISKKNTQLYSIAANTYLLSFIGRIKKMSHGLVKIIPKDFNGQPVTDMKNQLIDINSDAAGDQLIIILIDDNHIQLLPFEGEMAEPEFTFFLIKSQ
ncbi:MAG: bifunctional UDP-sugar hydrolase/5'-nucleotidase [Bacteroidales bacterium]|nr:bifunctional UDP-sugar hydrolase/5'-nucleotidase [Bacteroidales bacterium]